MRIAPEFHASAGAISDRIATLDIVRGVAVSREELRQKRATLAQVPETLRPIRRVDTKKLAKKRTTPKRAARH